MKQVEGLGRSLRTGLMVAVGLAAAIRPAAAQNQIDLSTGYLNVNGAMPGWNAQLSRSLTERWSVIGEFNQSQGRDCRRCDPTYHDFALLGGVRFGWHPTTRISPFWQVLAGGLRSRAEGYYQ